MLSMVDMLLNLDSSSILIAFTHFIWVNVNSLDPSELINVNTLNLPLQSISPNSTTLDYPRLA